MYGEFAEDPRANLSEPFEIEMQGLGVFSCRKDAWLGFNPRFRGFGGAEFYIHEKYRQAGHKCWCLPWFRWLHRFGRPLGVPYPLTTEDKLWNYLVGWNELGLSLEPIYENFLGRMTATMVARIASEALSKTMTISIKEQESGRESLLPISHLQKAS